MTGALVACINALLGYALRAGKEKCLCVCVDIYYTRGVVLYDGNKYRGGEYVCVCVERIT